MLNWTSQWLNVLPTIPNLGVCLDTDVLHTALVAIHNARCNPLLDPIENRLVF